MIACEDPAGCGDSGVSPYDSQLSGNVAINLTTYVHSDQPFEDPETGSTVNDITIQSPTEHVAFVAGYNNGGDPVVRTSFTDGPDPTGPTADQITSMNLVGNAVTSYNPYSQVTNTPPPPEAAGDSPMALLGDMTGASVTDNAVFDVTADNTPDGSGDRMTGGASLVHSSMAVPLSSAQIARITGPTVAGARTETKLIAPDRLQVSQSMMDREDKVESTIKHTKRFHKQDKQWVLDELRTESEDVDGARRVKLEHVMTFSNLRWVQKVEKNALRRTKRPTNEVIPLPGSHPYGEIVPSANFMVPGTSPAALAHTNGVPSGNAPFASGRSASNLRPSAMVACGPDDCGGGGGGGGPPPGGGGGGTTWDPGPDIGGCFIPGYPFYVHEPDGSINVATGGFPANANSAGYVHPDGDNIVFQHGIFSEAATWCDMETYLRDHVRIGWEARFSLNSIASYEDQASDLLNRVNGSRGSAGQLIFIGHSNGGIVSREVAHYVNGDPSLVRGVLTIDSPHQGAPISQVFNGAAAAVLAPLTSVAGCYFVSHQLCSALRGNSLQFVGGMVLPLALNGFAPVARELHPRSDFRGPFNATYEGFPRAAIQSKSWDKWTEWRMYGDMHCAPQWGCGGRAWAKFADQGYHSSIKCAIVGGLAGFFWHPAWGVAAGCAKLAAQLKGYDEAYKRLTVGGDSGDGIVPLQSQMYPGLSSELQFTIGDGDSHVGVLRGTDKSGPVVTRALNRAFGVFIR